MPTELQSDIDENIDDLRKAVRRALQGADTTEHNAFMIADYIDKQILLRIAEAKIEAKE